jgi:hypothetical protein
MPLVRYQSPDDPAFTVSGQSRFRVNHGVFYLRKAPLRDRISEILADQEGWNLAAMKLVQENRRLRACLEWLDSLPAEGEEVVVPELIHEPAIDLVADRLIGDAAYERAECPACAATYAQAEVQVEAWAYIDDGVTVRGRRSNCPRDHTIHALTDVIEDPEIGLMDD